VKQINRKEAILAEVNTEHLIEGLEEYFLTDKMKDLIAKMTEGGFRLNKLVVAVSIAMEAVVAVERLVADMAEITTPTGKEKREAVIKFIDDTVSLPFYLEPLDGIVVGIVIDAVVRSYNIKYGHGWLDLVKTFL